MVKTVIRRAADIRDGDEIVLRTPLAEENNDIALVLEKTMDEDDRVTLLVSVPVDAGLVTKPRPAELKDPFDAEG